VDQLVGKRTEEVLPADLVPETLQRIRQTLTTGESRAYEYKLWENEEWRDYEARLAASGSDEVLAIVRDITERKRLEQALQISLERYDRASQASGVGVWEWDIETSQIYIDPSFKAFLGYEDNAPIADPRELFAYVHPDDRVGLFESLYHYLEQPDHGYEFECRALTHAGGFRWMLIRGQAQGNDVGAPYRMSGTYIDISERKAAQLALQENERRYAAMLNAIPDVILRVHRDGTYLDFHPPHEASLSATPETVLGRSIYDLLPAPAAEEAMGYVRRALETGAMQVWETRMPCNDVLIDFEVRVVALNAEEVLMLGRNIQDRKEVARHQMESERTVLLRKFIADVSHDLRTPLATLMTSTFVIGKLGERLREVRQQILRQADLSAQARPLLDAMDQHVTKITERTVTLEKTSLRLQRVIEAMTDMVRLDGENIYNFKPHEMSDVVRRGLDGKQLVARERNIVLIVQFPEDPIVGLVDEGEFRHVVKNLVDNALDYTFPGGRVSVRLVLENNCPVIEVEDTGIGISEDDLPHIFDRFYRADKARSTETGGVGLGLAIVKRVVEAHNGRIEVRSRLGEGSIFRVTLPPYRDEA
jgi:PAS domain S-box-containing protein